MRLVTVSFITSPAFAAHSGVAAPRTGPELSDVALFVVAVGGVVFIRRALRKRFMKRTAQKD